MLRLTCLFSYCRLLTEADKAAGVVNITVPPASAQPAYNTNASWVYSNVDSAMVPLADKAPMLDLSLWNMPGIAYHTGKQLCTATWYAVSQQELCCEHLEAGKTLSGFSACETRVLSRKLQPNDKGHDINCTV